MKRNLDQLGRLTLPKGYRDELKVKEGDEVDIDCKDNQLIITNPKLKSTRSREEIEEKIKELEGKYKFGDNFLVDGFIEGLKWVIYEDYASNNK